MPKDKQAQKNRPTRERTQQLDFAKYLDQQKARRKPEGKPEGQKKEGQEKGQNLRQSLKQLSEGSLKKRRTHGGGPTEGRRKSYRPLSTKQTIHLVLRAQKARGTLSLRYKQNKQHVEHIIYKQARKFFVHIRGFANVGNHLHLEIQISARKDFQKFLKSISCLIARKITGARRGHKFGKFWDHLAFTRVLSSFFEEKILRRYIMANQLEALGGPFARAYFLDQWYNNRQYG